MEHITSVEQVSWHRNGIAGAGFHAVLFRWAGDGPPSNGILGPVNETVSAGALMLGIVFDEPGHVAVVAVEALSNPEVGVAFGANSWRGDRFEGQLREAIEKHNSDGSVRVGPFGIPTQRNCVTPRADFPGDIEQMLLQGYTDKGRTTSWREDLGPVRMQAMADREIFTLLGPDGKPYAKLLRDSYGTIREKRL